MNNLDIELEWAEMQHAAMLRSRPLLEPCPACGAFPKIEARDLYGYPKVTGQTHEPGCPDFVPVD